MNTAIEDSMKKERGGRGSREDSEGKRVISFTSLGHFINDGTMFLVPVVLDLMAVVRHIDPIIITVSLTLFYLSMAATAVLLGGYIDRKGLQSSGMAIGILTMSLGLLLFIAALDDLLTVAIIIISSILSGFGASFYHPTGTSMLQSHYRGEKLGRYLGINGSFGSIGRAIYPYFLLAFIAYFASEVAGIGILGTIGVLAAISMFIGLRGYSTPQYKEKKGAKEWKSTLSLSILLLTAISLIRSLAFYGIVSWIPEYLSFDRGLKANLSLGSMMSLMYVGGIVGQLIFGRLVEVYDKRRILATTTVLSAALMYLYIITSGTLSYLFLGLFGLVNFSSFPILMSMISDYVPRESSTTTSNALVWNVGGSGGQALGPLIVGVAIAGSYSNLPVVFEILLILALVASVLTFVLPKPAVTKKAPIFG
ncbi:MAG: MFS transporter [Thermoplasmatales archaeon]